MQRLSTTLIDLLKHAKRVGRISAYRLGGRKPWGRGYFEYKWQHIQAAIRDQSIMNSFAQGEALPPDYGRGIDERMVEFPWALSRISDSPLSLLDAGSTLNFIEILRHPRIINKKVSIVTLVPEFNCFWKMGVSYVYDDIRQLPFKDEEFDVITCLSTLEHVGMNNSLVYTKDGRFKENNAHDYRLAILELRRVLKPGGKLILTVPYGKYEDHSFFQQFDEDMVADTVKVFDPSTYKASFFRYEIGRGWDKAMKEQCDDVGYVGGKHNSEIAGASAIIGMELTKAN